MAERLARAAVAHRVLIPIVAAAVLVACGVVGSGVFSRLQPYGADDPATQSVKVDKAIERSTHAQSTPGVVVLLPSGRDIGAVQRVLRADSTTAYLGRPLPARKGHKIAIPVFLRPLSDRTLQQHAHDLVGKIHRLAPGSQVGGFVLANDDANRFVEHDLLRAEAFAIPIIVLLAFVFFRSFVAAAIPPAVGILAVLVTLLGLRIATAFTGVSVYAVNISTGLGLGLAIDYSLLFVYRYREELAARGEVQPALAATLATAGRTVLVSSLTVSAALASLLVFPQRFLYSMGLGGAIVAAAAAAITLLVLPPVLALLGPRIDALAPARLQRARQREATVAQDGAWYRLASFVLRRPVLVAVPVAVLLLAAGTPFLRAQFQTVDERVLPPGTESRVTADEMRANFGGSAMTPAVVRVTLPASDPRVAAVARRAEHLAGVAGVTPPRPSGPRASAFDVVLRDAASSSGAARSVRALRAQSVPGAALGVTGATASFLDARHSVWRHLPLAALIVSVTTLVALFLLTGSLLLPIKALAMNVLSLSAVLGLLVLVFQDGRLEALLGYQSIGALELTMPVLLFAIAFGLSTDYGVFLLARIKEEHDRGRSNREAVAIGLERTGRIVTAAALLFCIAFGSFVTCRLVFMKEAGLGTALAVIIDASLIRAFLVPALMGLLGDWNWWAPRPLRRLWERVGIREESLRSPDARPRASG